MEYEGITVCDLLILQNKISDMTLKRYKEEPRNEYEKDVLIGYGEAIRSVHKLLDEEIKELRGEKI